MKRKDSTVSLIGLVPEMRRVLSIVDHVWKKNGQEAVITAGTEIFKDNRLIHSAGSFHPFGKALDFRTNHFKIEYTINIDTELIDIIAKKLRNKLGNDYDVIVHDGISGHMHVEFDPK